jgi:hypothetical protein
MRGPDRGPDDLLGGDLGHRLQGYSRGIKGSERTKEVTSVMIPAMRNFQSHHGINRDGCLVLQRVCRHLTKRKRKRLEVVASLGSGVASESIDTDAKDIGNGILEEQLYAANY